MKPLHRWIFYGSGKEKCFAEGFKALSMPSKVIDQYITQTDQRFAEPQANLWLSIRIDRT